jgi:hydrogenase maturation protein HypF
MTSGNLSEEPIVGDNDEALRRLRGIADYFLIHNRDIYSVYDDSVAVVERNTSQLMRRARSYAPYPIRLPFKARQVLGCGAEEKNTFCLTKDNYAFISQHIGDMENMETLEHFDTTLSLYKRLFHIKPEIIAS